MKAVTKERLEQTIAEVEHLLAAAKEEVGERIGDDWSGWHQRIREAADGIAAKLAASHGAVSGVDSMSNHFIRLAGVRSVSSNGMKQALTNWMTAARRRIEKEAGR